MATLSTATPQTPQRPGLKSGVATEFTIYTNVIPGHEGAIREAIKRATADPRREEAVKQIGTLHEARWVLFDNDTRLMFASSFDGSWDKYIDDFASTYIATIFDAVFSHCQGYPGLQDPGIKEWFLSYAREAVGYISAYPEATVKDIWRALDLEHAFQRVLDSPGAAEALAAPVLKPLLDRASN